MSYLDEAIALERDALDLHPEGHPDRATSLSKLAGFLHSRFQQLGILSDLEEAVTFQRNVLELCPDGHSDRPASLGFLSLYLYRRFEQLGMLSDIEEALALERSAFALYPPEDPNRAAALGNIASFLYVRFERLGGLSDLEESIAVQRSVLEFRPEGHSYRSVSLGNLASAIYSRFKQLGVLSDLEEAITMGRSTLELRPQGHPDRATSLSNLASSLHSRFQRLGRLSDLEESLVLQRNVLELRPQGHPKRASSLDELALSLSTRFQQLGVLSDLEEALVLQRSALELLPQDHPGRARSMNYLAGILHARFEQLGTQSDLEEAIALEQHALELRPQGHPGRSTSLGNLAHYLRSRFEQHGSLSDLDEAIALARDALELHTPGHLHRAVSLGNLSAYLYSRFKLLGTLSDLDEAISLERTALELRPQGHPLQAHSLGNLAHYLQARFKHSDVGDICDLQEAFNLYSKLSNISDTVSPSDLECSKRWIQAAEEHQHSTTVSAYQTFSRLSFHHISMLPPLPRHLASLKQLMRSTAVNAFSACVRYGNFTSAVELLEQGRGVFWTQLSHLCTSLEEIIASGDMGKKLAGKFRQVASLLHAVLDSPPDAESYNWACHFNTQLQDIVSQIRNVPGHSRFLLPSLFPDLQLAATGGPVIIVNASAYSCDALVVLLEKDPIHVALPITGSRVSELSLELHFLISRAGFSDVTKELLKLLRELWDAVVFPIVKVLLEYQPIHSRIWWCPTAEFSLLPLHAAGSFRKSEPMLSDLYISSYTPTLTALIRARQKTTLDPPIEGHRFLIMGQTQAPGQSNIASASTELSSILQRTRPNCLLTCVQDQDATIAKAAEEFKKNAFVHLACRGVPDRDQPFESGFALADGLLKVQDIMRYDLPNAQFAYLSASHTTVGDEECLDEVIHLAAAMQFAGFRSVIGTMWAVEDEHANEIASQFYEHLFDGPGCDGLDHTRAALALHRTMTHLRSSGIPLDQRILYIHIGA